ncbi:MAG: extracellular solute-binding protein [Chloroflexi bacterium]|nr:extracellular solute-binding protein [Chloroflexota bacterium]
MEKKWSEKLFVSLLLLLAVAALACAPRAAPAPAPATPTRVSAPASRPSAASTPVNSQDADWQTLVTGARKEGRVTLYTSFGGAELRSVLGRAMEENYGIKIEWLVSTGPGNTERIRVEQRARQYMGDLLWSGSSPLMLKTLREAGAVQSFMPLAVLREPNVWDGRGIDSFTDKGDAITISRGLSAIPLVSTNALKPEEYPRSYKDLLDPKWRGRVAFHDPTIPGSGNLVFGLAKRELGLEYWEKMKDQQITVIRDYGEIGRRVAIGEAWVGAAMSIGEFMPIVASGAPITPIPIAEGSIKANYVASLLNNAPHPNAAKVFINWALSREGQATIFRQLGLEPVRKDVEFKYHPKVEAIVRAMPKWLIYSFDVAEDYEQEIVKGTARKVLGLK